jgi:diguanylate cyclase (GGDEF)-like protein
VAVSDPSPEADAAGRVAGVEVVAEVGRGAHAVVFRVRRGARPYALKVFRSTWRDDDVRGAAFRREAALLAGVNHPGVVRIHEVGVSAGHPYLLMDLVEGDHLTDALHAGPLPEDRLVAVGADVARALRAVHAAGLVHRDVKPGNVVLATDGAARLVDFGLAVRTADDGDGGGGGAGTLAYSAPEQSGTLRRRVDGRSDLYALGATLFESATGGPPFVTGDVGELLRMHAVVPAPDARQVRPDLSPATAAVLRRLLAKDPDDRYQSATALVADLEWVAGELAAARSPGDLPAGRHEAPDAPAEIPLVGRVEELTTLRERWERARCGEGGTALVLGVAGSGKSRLVRELTAEARHAGGVVLHGRAGPGDPPLAPLRAAVDEYVRAVRRLPAGAAIDRLRDIAVRSVAGTTGIALLRGLSAELADLVGAPATPAETGREQFVTAVASLLAGLAASPGPAGGVVLHLDDVQWLDDLTRRVLHRLATLPETRLLVLATGSDDHASRAGVAAFRSGPGGQPDAVVRLGAMDADLVCRLVAAATGMSVDAATASRLAARCGGNPLTVLEYFNAVVDAGLAVPHWGTWRIVPRPDGREGPPADGLQQLDLPADASELILKRVETLDAVGREVLGTAAVVGPWFSPALVAEAAGTDPGQVAAVVEEATSHHLVERRDGGSAGEAGLTEYGFLHTRVREALLSRYDDAALRARHDRVADALELQAALTRPRDADAGAATAGEEASPGLDPAVVYAVAHHRLRGDVAGNPGRVFRAAFAAGRQAMADHAPAEAVAHLERAAEAAAAAGLEPGAELRYLLGLGLHETGRFEAALRTLDGALEVTTDAVQRAEIRHLAARVHESMWNGAAAIDSARRALAELGRPVPRNPLRLAASTLRLFLLGSFVRATRIGFGTATGRRREAYRLQLLQYQVLGPAHTREMQPLTAVAMMLRSRYVVNRLGPSPEYVRGVADLAFTLAVLGRSRRRVERLVTEATTVAATFPDPRLSAHVPFKVGLCAWYSGADAGQALVGAVHEHRAWLDRGSYHDSFVILAWDLVLQGDMATVEEWFRLRREAVAADGRAGRLEVHPFEAALPALRGRHADAAELLAGLRGDPDAPLWQRLDVLVATMYAALEQGDLGPGLDETIAEFDAFGITPRNLLAGMHAVYVLRARARVQQYRRATPQGRRARRAQARAALKDLAGVAGRPLLRAYLGITRAMLADADGDPQRVLDELTAAEPDVRAVDAPLVEFEVARLRARALRALGAPGAASLQAGLALSIAERQGWPHRVRWVRAEHDGHPGVDAGRGSAGHRSGARSSSPSLTAGRGPQPAADVVAAGWDRQRLAALEQVSLAASRIVDPDRLARIALDETVRILRAERAFLFLADPATGTLRPHLGRDAAGGDLHALTAYSVTLVDRVWHSREPLVVTGTDEGAALGSTSIAAHGLRSIMAAPLRLEDRMLGVVYLDSRVAQGIFTDEDAGILMAITNHVAITLETARAAQLQVDVEAAHRRRDLAETLRHAMVDLSATLDPDVVLRRLLATTHDVLGAGATCLLRRAGDLALLVVHEPEPAPGGPQESGPLPVSRQEPGLARGHAPRRLVVDDGLARLLAVAGPAAPPAVEWPRSLGTALGVPAPRSWLVTPLRARRDDLGVLVLAANGGEGFGEAQGEIAAAIAEHGMTAYENARLFAEVQQLATVDGLTQLANRRHFMDRAAAVVAGGHDDAEPLWAMMIDIDHFKQVNDTYGHQAGDDVIRSVADLIVAAARPGDLAGRYGGEEFALLLHRERSAAIALAERLRAEVAAEPLRLGGRPVAVTISAGLARLRPDDAGAEALLARADARLYEAKRAGRDRVVAED